ncbi:MAG: hypothetical protein NUV51_10020 [Sulfuricaulis sp.]|nr:hypothetical protein [Sulfuricaulis sp.]
MAFIFGNQSDTFSLSATLAKGNMILRVLAPSNSSGFAALSADMTTASFQYLSGGGYADVTMNLSAWSVPVFSANSAESSAVGPTAGAGFLFAFSAVPSTQTASGFALETSTNKLFYAEYFSDGPYYLTNAGDTVEIKPVIRST